MTTLDEIAFIRRALREKSIDPEHLRRAYVHRRAGRTKRSIPRLLLKNRLVPRELLEQLCVEASEEAPLVSAELRSPENHELLLQILASDPESPKIQDMRLGLSILKECVGIGGEACVYRAHHIAFQHDVVVKALLPGVRRKAAGLERLRREAEICSRLNHPNISKVFDFDVAGFVPYVVFEFVEGETLHSRIERFGRLTASEVVSLGYQVSIGLQAAHAEGLLHRDFKPSNIMVSTAGKAKIIDFGFARDLSVPGHITATGFIVGTPYYTAPEYGQENPIDGRADLYSLGVTLYYALTGVLPFESRSIVRLLAMHLQEKFPPIKKHVPGAPPRLVKIIEKLLAKAPEDRFSSAEELAEMLIDPQTLKPGTQVLEVESPAPSTAAELSAVSESEETQAYLGKAGAPDELSQYDFIPKGLLQTFIVEDEEGELDDEAPPRQFFYPGAGQGDNGLEDSLMASRSGGRQTDILPNSDADLPAYDPSKGKSPQKSRQKTTSDSLPVAESSNEPTAGRKSRGSKRLLRVPVKASGRIRVGHSGPGKDSKRVYCGACEEPIKKAKKILGNIVCLQCADHVKDHRLCTACFGKISEKQERTVVFRRGRYCPFCAKRVILYCAHCRERFPLGEIARGAASEIEGKPYCTSCSHARKPGAQVSDISRSRVESSRVRPVKGSRRTGRTRAGRGSRRSRRRRN
jgi:serine/threonine protein kinase